jgi:hypothetical protein
MGVTDRILVGGQRVTRTTINAFVGPNNYAMQELRPPTVPELTQGVAALATFPLNVANGSISKSK